MAAAGIARALKYSLSQVLANDFSGRNNRHALKNSIMHTERQNLPERLRFAQKE